jgi:eukaryotic-like serine/threonine-protein kinase
MGRLVHRGWLLGFAVLALGGLGWVLGRRAHRPAPPPPPVEVIWAFEAHQRGAIASSPLAAGDRLWVAAIHDTAFTNAGAVYCLDRATGKQLWRFDDGGKMQHMYSSPCLAEGRLYLGEGMHANFTCKLYCLDAASGRKQWDFEAEGHIESSPCVAGGRVFFGAGDDGIYCLDAATGKKRWQFRGPYHIDSSPAVWGRRLYAGSGVSRTHETTVALCLDTRDGGVLWRVGLDLPVWGSPAVGGEEVFFGLGNGRLTTGPDPPEKPAGALVCLTAEAGRCRWRYDVGDAVVARAALDARHVFFGARNGRCYCLDRRTGRLCWKHDLGSPVMTTPALLDDRLYVVASGGRVCCLDADTGRARWTFEVAKHSRANPQLYSSPVAVAEAGEDGPARRIYFGAELGTAGGNAAVLYCLGDR